MVLPIMFLVLHGWLTSCRFWFQGSSCACSLASGDHSEDCGPRPNQSQFAPYQHVGFCMFLFLFDLLSLLRFFSDVCGSRDSCVLRLRAAVFINLCTMRDCASPSRNPMIILKPEHLSGLQKANFLFHNALNCNKACLGTPFS